MHPSLILYIFFKCTHIQFYILFFAHEVINEKYVIKYPNKRFYPWGKTLLQEGIHIRECNYAIKVFSTHRLQIFTTKALTK